jgi:protocatechuate 3,4-dioxygenase beta subunit
MCNFAPVQIGDRLWFDADADGIQDPGELPVVGATVNLRDSSGTIIDTATTDANGEYRFSSTTDPLVVGQSFSITIDDPADYAPGGILAGWAPSKLGVGTEIDSDGDIVDGYPRISVPMVSAGFNDHSFDVGFATKVSVGGMVWNDTDGDGFQDSGDSPLSGVRLDLSLPNGDPVTDRLGRVVTSLETEPDGTYSFDFLPTGTYRVTATSPSGMIATLGLVDTSDPLVAAGSSDPNMNFAFRQTPVILPIVTVSVGDQVWNDLDGDGVRDPGEPGIIGVRVTIRDADGSPVVDVNGNPVTTTTTDADGNYIFTNLPPGQYVVTVAGPAGFVASNSAALSGSVVSQRLSGTNASDLTLDFGYTARRHSIAGNVWLDSDRSATRSGSEQNIVGVEVRLLNPDGSPALDVFGRPVAPVFTDADGNYVFESLAPGDYVVALTPPWGLAPTNFGVGVDSATIRLDVALAEGQSVTGLDVGLAAPPRLPVTGSSDEPFVVALWVLVFGILISARRSQPS